MTFLREIWDKKAAKREVEVTTRKEYEEKVSSLRNGIDYGVTVNNDVAMRITAVFAAIRFRSENIDPGKVFEGEYELKFQLDAPTFINYYSNIFTKAALSRVTGINERQLWRYAAGKNVPRKEQLEKFQKGINKLTRELQSISFL